MQVLFENIKKDLKQYNRMSYYILKYGTIILVILILLSVIVKIMINNSLSDFSLEFFYEDLLECIKEAFGAIYFGAFTLEFLYRIYKKDGN